MKDSKKEIKKAEVEIIEFDKKDDIVTISVDAGGPWQEEEE